MRERNPKTGRFDLIHGTHVDSKGYLSICAGPLRGVRLHRIVAEAKLGRKLRKDEVVHHKNGNKLDCSPENLQIMGEREHNAVSAKQRWYLETHVYPREKAEFEKFHPGATT